MDPADIVLCILVCGGLGLLCIWGLARYLAGYFQAVKFVKLEIRRAGDWMSYVHWRRELSALRLSLIPGITPDRAKRILKRFYRGKYLKEKEESDGLTAMLLPSLLGIGLCAVCLAGGTYAWFSATQSAPAQVIQSAQYSVSTQVLTAEGTQLPAYAGAYTLEAGQTYTVVLTAAGDASTGYCILNLEDARLHTVQIPVGTSLTFTLETRKSAVLTVTAQWGSSTRPEAERLAPAGAYTYGDPAPETEDIPE